MTPFLIREIYNRSRNGGFKAAYAAAVASGESRLIREVFLISLEATGFAMPKPVFKKNGRGGISTKPSCFAEGMPPAALAELREELERRRNRPPRSQNGRHPRRDEPDEEAAFKRQFSRRFPGPAPVSVGGRLTAAETARRHAALAAAGVVRA